MPEFENDDGHHPSLFTWYRPKIKPPMPGTLARARKAFSDLLKRL